MRLYYHHSASGNFGDDLNEWLWDELLPGWRNWDPAVTLVGVGTLLSSTFIRDELRPERRYLVAGTGAGYGDGRVPDITATPGQWDVRSVRGPRTAAALGLPPEIGVVDPAVMLADLLPAPSRVADAQAIFVPHESSTALHDWPKLCRSAGIRYVSPCGPAREVIAAIAGARLVLAESMHAAIIADAYRVPWRPIQVSWHFNREKWYDWAESLGLTIEIPAAFPEFEDLSQRLRRLRRRRGGPGGGDAPVRRADPLRPETLSWRKRLRLRGEAALLPRRLRHHLGLPPYLSDKDRLDAAKSRYRHVLDGIARDYGSA